MLGGQASYLKYDLERMSHFLTDGGPRSACQAIWSMVNGFDCQLSCALLALLEFLEVMAMAH